MKKRVFILAAILFVSLVSMAQTLYNGPEVKCEADLKAYTGLEAVNRIEGDFRKKIYMVNYEQLAINYGENVEFQLRRKFVLLSPQTEKYLYSAEAVPAIRYQKGSRPFLEEKLFDIVYGAKNNQEKAIRIMRFCRDLKRNKMKSFYGGTEEQLIRKNEDLCETLARLFVALCEVENIPARIVHHVVAGHLVAEAYIDGKWSYFDPRFGIYFLNSDGKIASLQELLNDPSITLKQSKKVKEEVLGPYTWEQRAKRTRDFFLNPQEINGFHYYSLADSKEYTYGIVPMKDAELAGLFRVSNIYAALTAAIFGTDKEGRIEDFFWKEKPLKKLPLRWRNDGYTDWWEMKPPVDPAKVEKRIISPFIGSGFDYLVLGTGPGSTLTHRTKAGELFGHNVTEEQWKRLCVEDKNVHIIMTDLIKQGHDPMALKAQFAHKHGMKMLARLEMGHEFPKNHYAYAAFTSMFVKNNPHLRLKRNETTVVDDYHLCGLDYLHKEVRDYRLAILRELAECGADGLELDFAVYPEFVSRPDGGKAINEFIRDTRKMLDEVGAKNGKHMVLQVCLPSRLAKQHSLDWPTWIKEGWVDYLVPSINVAVHANNERRHEFDVPIDEYVRVAKQYGSKCKIYGRMDQSLRIFNMDPMPDGIRRHSREKTNYEKAAQALMFMRSGADGIQFAMAASSQFRRRERYLWIDDPANVIHADKNYIDGPFPALQEIQAKGKKFTVTQSANFRIADNIAEANKQGISSKGNFVLNFRPLNEWETVEVYINGNGPLIFTGKKASELGNNADAVRLIPNDEDLQTKDWWKRGEHNAPFPTDWLWFGENIIRIVYNSDKPAESAKIQFLWPEIQIRYDHNTKE